MIQKVIERLKEVEGGIVELEENDLIEVLWLDACMSRDVKRLTNRAFATYKRSVGYFWQICHDTRYRYPHLILKNEITDGDCNDITSIPIGWIVRVKRVSEGLGASSHRDKKLYKVPIPIIKLKRAENLGEGGTKLIGVFSDLTLGKD